MWGVGTAGTAFFLFFYSHMLDKQGRPGPSKTAILGAMEPVTALLIGRIAFGESLSWLQILFICIILGSVALVVTSKPPTSTKQKQ